MAVDTRDRRMSLIGFASSVPRMLPNPDGSMDLADRPQLLFLYAGLTLDVIVVAFVTGTVLGVSPTGTVLGVSPTGTLEDSTWL